MPQKTDSRIPANLVIGTGAVIFLANAGLLVLQLATGRFLAPFIGSSIETWTCVIGVFLTGIAIGNWLGGRLADRFPSPRTVAVLLVLGGLSSLGMIGCYEYSLHSGFYRAIPLTARIPLLTFLFCFLPALLLSLLTPLTIKLLLPDIGSAGRVAGLIFALSTLGCLIGNYFTGFWLMAEFTLNEITAGVGFSLIVLAIPAFLVRHRPPAAAVADQPATMNLPELNDGDWNFRGNIRIAYAIVFLASFCGMSLELTGSRLLAPFLGVSLFTWTGIIGVMLAGTCCGNYLGGILADRGVGPALRRFAFLMGALIGAASAPFLIRAFLPDFNPSGRGWIENGVRVLAGAIGILFVLPGMWLSTRRHGTAIVAGGLGGVLGTVLAHTAGRAIDTAFSLPAFTRFHEQLSNMLGFDAAPVVIHGVGFLAGVCIALLFVWDKPAQIERTSRTGALCGSLLLAGLMTLAILVLMGIYTNAGFMLNEEQVVQKVLAWTFGLFFMPMLLLGAISPQVIRLSIPDIQSAGRVAGSVYAWSTAGAIVGTFATGYFMISSIGTFRVLMVLAFLLTLLAFFVGRLWKNNAMLYTASIIFGGAIFGLFIVNFGSNRFDMETQYYAIRVTEKNQEGHRRAWLDLDHLTHSVVDLDDLTWLYYDHEYIQGELLNLARSRHDKTNLLIIGGGGYSFPRFAEHFWPDVSNEVVEIDPGVTEIAHKKLNLPRDTRIRSHNMDGRQFISEQAPKGHYHLVMQDAVNDYSVPGHLMTVEYNNLIKQTLTPDGVYLLTFIDSLRDGRFWRAAVRTMRATFPHVYLLSPSGFFDEVKVVENGQTVLKPVVAKARHVYVLYGSNQPLDQAALSAVTAEFVRNEYAKRENVVALVSPLAVDTAEAIAPWMLRSYSNVLDQKTLDELLDDPRFDKIVLSDQFCPVDNLMSDIFRESLKKRD